MGKHRIPSRKRKNKQRKTNSVKLLKSRKGRRSRKGTTSKEHVQQTSNTSPGVILVSCLILLVLLIVFINIVFDSSEKNNNNTAENYASEQTSSSEKEPVTSPAEMSQDIAESTQSDVADTSIPETQLPDLTSPELPPDTLISPETEYAFINGNLRIKIANTWQSLAVNISVPAFSGTPFTEIQTDTGLENLWSEFESCDIILSPHDELGRAGSAIMHVKKENLPEGEKGEKGSYKPSGWHQEKYPGIVDSEPPYIYNRAHLLMWALSGLTSEQRNLITGTRYFNLSGMLPGETEVLERAKAGDELLYRVTPIYEGDDLLARGVLMEAVNISGTYSMCRFAYNVQPGIIIDYATGLTQAESERVQETTAEVPTTTAPIDSAVTYVLNKNTHKFHLPTCPSVKDIKPKNRIDFYGTKEEAEALGYVGCKRCKP